jgi:hypothetical protein
MLRIRFYINDIGVNARTVTINDARDEWNFDAGCRKRNDGEAAEFTRRRNLDLIKFGAKTTCASIPSTKKASLTVRALITHQMRCFSEY